jgi:hypothetical protein
LEYAKFALVRSAPASVPHTMSDPGDSTDARRPDSEPPRFPELSVANIRLSRRIDARSPDEFESGLSQVERFARLGSPSPWDDGCARIFTWRQWPGPEQPSIEAFALAQQDMKDRIFAEGLAAGDLPSLFERVNTQVMEQARRFAPFDPRQDAWHGPTLCVWEAGYTAALVTCVLACCWPVPDDLAEIWAWFEAGHWPSGFAAKPGDLPGDRYGNRLAFPRQLLVF